MHKNKKSNIEDVENKTLIVIVVSILFAANVLAWIAVFQLAGPPVLEVIFFDVGQGDATLIKTPRRHQILIDGGPSAVIVEKLGKEMPFWDRTIELIILTHPEHDHISGLIDVLKRYKVSAILWTGVVRDTAEYKEWTRLIREEGTKVIIAKAGQKIDLCYCEIFYPSENLEGQKRNDSNNTSIVIKLTFGETSFLFTGDAYKSVETKLVRLGTNIDSDVLKVGHHGSKTSSAPEFIEAVSPQIAVITAGKDNTYGHPHQEVLDTLANYGVNVLGTYQEGDIKIISDGENLFF